MFRNCNLLRKINHRDCGKHGPWFQALISFLRVKMAAIKYAMWPDMNKYKYSKLSTTGCTTTVQLVASCIHDNRVNACNSAGPKIILSCLYTLSHCSLLAQAFTKAAEMRFPHLFSYSNERMVFAATVACHTKFKLQQSQNNIVKEALLPELVNSNYIHHEWQKNVQPGTDQVTAVNKIGDCGMFTLSRTACFDSLDTLHGFTSVKYLFHKLTATVPSTAPVVRLLSSGYLICTAC